jgi:hypothetical protein
MDDTLGQFGGTIAGALGGAVTDHQVARGELTIIANAPVERPPPLFTIPTFWLNCAR